MYWTDSVQPIDLAFVEDCTDWTVSAPKSWLVVTLLCNQSNLASSTVQCFVNSALGRHKRGFRYADPPMAAHTPCTPQLPPTPAPKLRGQSRRPARAGAARCRRASWSDREGVAAGREGKQAAGAVRPAQPRRSQDGEAQAGVYDGGVADLKAMSSLQTCKRWRHQEALSLGCLRHLID